VINIKVDAPGFSDLRDLGVDLERIAKQAGEDLAAMAYGKAVELAGERLHSRRQMFVDGLHLVEQDGVKVLQLDANVRWIDDGLPPHDMLDALLASPKAKFSKDGSRYLVVPFGHGPGKGATNTPTSSQPMVEAVKREMKARKIPWARIERDADGNALMGRLHKFDVRASIHPAKTGQGAGQGWGPEGAVRQGPNERQLVGGGPGGGGRPFLSQVNVYQRPKPGGGVQRSVVSFRIASSKHRGDGRWHYPGIEGAGIFDEVEAWSQRTLDQDILPKLLAKLDAI
jgi:hypothetical protein